MKKMSELMDELGFDPEGSSAVKEAFVKYLIKSSQGINVLTPAEKTLIKASPSTVTSLSLDNNGSASTNQMQFDFMSEPSQKSIKRPKTC